jgi:zinc D-Ala-D-Ala carboxypeptidase
MNLTEHFTLDELTVSETAARKGIDNDPPPAVLERLKYTARGLEHIRLILGVPLIITSGYRSPALNAEVGGSNNSQHTRGEAADFIAPRFGTPLEVCNALTASDVRFDQLIWEGGWVHVSFTDARTPRREILTWKRGQGYSVGLNA